MPRFLELRMLSIVIIIITLIVAFAAISQYSIKPAFAYHCAGHHHIAGPGYDLGAGPCPVPDTQPEDPCGDADPPPVWCLTEPQVLDANAGEDQQVTKKNQVIQLDGTGSGGTGLKYNWIMKEGPSSVVLDNPKSTNPTFVFPTSEEFDGGIGRKVTFQLEVTNEGGTETDTVEIKDSCFIEEQPFKTYNSGPWSFKYGIVEKQGLVLKDIRAGREQLFDSISIPHFKIADSAGNEQIIRFCDPGSSGETSFWHGEGPSIVDESSIIEGDGISNLTWRW